MNKPTLQEIADTIVSNGHVLFTNPYDVNLGGIRTKDNSSNQFNDFNFCFYFDEEEQIYKCWYSPFIIDERSYSTSRERRTTVSYGNAGLSKREMGVCYAVSEDGIAWEKPELGLIDFKDSTKNNLVQRETHGAGVSKDLRDPDPARRAARSRSRQSTGPLQGSDFL